VEEIMQFKKFVFCVTGPLVCVAAAACGGSSKSANSPNSIDDAALAEARQSHEDSSTAPDDRVGMEYQDKGDDSAAKRDRTPPPTPTYKPSNKVKQASTAQ
jgi:hypothetical protein